MSKITKEKLIAIQGNVLFDPELLTAIKQSEADVLRMAQQTYDKVSSCNLVNNALWGLEYENLAKKEQGPWKGLDEEKLSKSLLDLTIFAGFLVSAGDTKFKC